MTAPVRCPCGTGEEYAACCGPRHTGAAPAPTAEALMRARFTAFAIGDAAYLRRSWHASTRPARLDLDPSLRWTRLEIVATVAGGPFDRTGVVEFRAHHRTDPQVHPDGTAERGVLHERSRFVRADGAWFYVDGDTT